MGGMQVSIFALILPVTLPVGLACGGAIHIGRRGCPKILATIDLPYLLKNPGRSRDIK